MRINESSTKNSIKYNVAKSLGQTTIENVANGEVRRDYKANQPIYEGKVTNKSWKHAFNRTKATLSVHIRNFTRSANPRCEIVNISGPVAFLVNSYLTPSQQ